MVTRRRLLGAWCGAVVLGPLLAACRSTRGESSGPVAVRPGNPGGLPTGAAGPATSVAMVGDSITEGSTLELNIVLSAAGFTDVVIDGQTSRRIAVGNGTSEPLAGIRVVENLVAQGVTPDVWVIALGTNDVGGQPDEAAYGQLIDSLLVLLPVDARVVWIDVYRPSDLEHTLMFNSVVRQRMGARSNGSVGSWYDKASDPDADLLRSDNLHPNDAGRTVFAQVVGTALTAS